MIGEMRDAQRRPHRVDVARAFGPLALLSLALVGGCALFVSFDDATLGDSVGGAPSTGGGGGSPAGGQGGGGGQGGTGGGGQGGAGGAPIECGIYVSKDGGSDESDGLSPTSAVATIEQGLAIAAGLDTPPLPKEVCVCGLVYEEAPLSITRDVRLRGGLDCETWERVAEADYPMLDGTRVSLAQGSEDGPVLTLEGLQVTSSTLIDGFRFVTPALPVPPTLQRVAVLVANGAFPEIEHCFIGDEEKPVNPQEISVAARVLTGAHPRLRFVALRGGRGNGNSLSPASAGLWLLDATATLEQCAVSGGGDTDVASAGSSLGILAENSALVVEDCLVSGGRSTSAVFTLPASGGIVASSAAVIAPELRVTRTVVHGGQGSGAVPATGVLIDGVDAELFGNAIFGGVGSGTGRAGVLVRGRSQATLVSNAIHAGENANAPRAIAIEADPLAKPIRLYFNSLSSGDDGSGAGVGVTVGAADMLELYVERNLFLADGREALYVEAAGGLDQAFVSLKHNAFLAPTSVLSGLDGLTPVTFTNLAALETTLTAVVASDNRLFSAMCESLDTACTNAACGQASCGAVTPEYSYSGDAVVEIPPQESFPTGWMIADGPLCCELKAFGPAPPAAPAVPDYYGNLRADPFSFGAHEHALCTQGSCSR